MFSLETYYKAKRTQLEMVADQGYSLSAEEQFLLTSSREQMTLYYQRLTDELINHRLLPNQGPNYFNPTVMSRMYIKNNERGELIAMLVYFDDSIGDSFGKKDFARFQRILDVYRNGVQPVPANVVEKSPESMNSIYRFLHVIYRNDPGMLYYAGDDRVVRPIQYQNLLKEVTLILRVKPTTTSGGTREQLMLTFSYLDNIRVFLLPELMSNPQRHLFAPVYTPLSDTEKQEHLSDKRASQIPVFQRTKYGKVGVIDDPQAKYAGWNANQIIRITREQFLAPAPVREIVSYRIVKLVQDL